MTKSRPFLKWPGGKYRLVDEIVSRLPTGKVFAEPFVGSGAIFLNTNYEQYHLNDINTDLITLYRMLKAEPREFIDYAKRFFQRRYNNERRYYALREEFNAASDVMHKSALFLYLNRHGYNGLCRYNQQGGFNVPFGRYDKPYFPERELILFAAKAQNAIFENLHFEEFMCNLKRKTVIYCDPPYVPLNRTANFTSYFASQFNQEEQELLAQLAVTLQKKKKNIVFISNHDTDFTRALYKQAKIVEFNVARQISCRPCSRVPVAELLAMFVSETVYLG